MTVYFVQSDCGRIKIGYTGAENATERLNALKVGSPRKLTLLLEVDGNPSDEQELHARFAHARVHGEWFEPATELLYLIEVLRESPSHLSMSSQAVPEAWETVRRHWENCDISRTKERDIFSFEERRPGASASWLSTDCEWSDTERPGLQRSARLLLELSSDPDKLIAFWILAYVREANPPRGANPWVHFRTERFSILEQMCRDKLRGVELWHHAITQVLPISVPWENEAMLPRHWRARIEQVQLIRAAVLGHYRVTFFGQYLEAIA